MNALCITPDTFEPNDSEAAAAQYTGAVDVATIDHPGDSDWIKLTPQLAHVTVNNDWGLTNSDDFTAELYCDGVLVATSHPLGDWPWKMSLDYSGTGGLHDWKLHMTAGHPTVYTLKYQS
jgi:hypothetical protein